MVEIVLKNGEHFKWEENEYMNALIYADEFIIFYERKWYDAYPLDNILYYKVKEPKWLDMGGG